MPKAESRVRAVSFTLHEHQVRDLLRQPQLHASNVHCSLAHHLDVVAVSATAPLAKMNTMQPQDPSYMVHNQLVCRPQPASCWSVLRV